MRKVDLGSFEALAGDVEPHLSDISAKSAKHILAKYSVADDKLFEQISQDVFSYAESRSAELVGMARDEDGALVPNPKAEWRIDDDTRTMLRSAVKNAFAEGMTKDELSSYIEDSAGFSEWRAQNIAHTELAMANAAGNDIAIRSTGLKMKKRSLLSADHTIYDECDDNAEADWVPYDEPYPSGDMSYPFHPGGCACDEEYMEATDEEDDGE